MSELANELIVVEQLPVIKNQLLAFKGNVEERVNVALSLVCNEDTYKEVKKVRSELNKEYELLEKRRKEIKSQILAPYDEFEAVYKDCAGGLYADADKKLAAKIREVEDGLKQQKAEDLETYFNEYRASVGIDSSFVSIDDAHIKVGLSDSKTSLHKQAAAFIDRIVDDLKVIESLESRDEVLAEYSQDYNLSKAMLTVENRHKLIEAERQRREAAKAAEEAAKAAEVKVEEAVKAAEAPAVMAPVKEPAKEAEWSKPVEEKILTCTFTVKASREKLVALKKFLTEGGYDYE